MSKKIEKNINSKIKIISNGLLLMEAKQIVLKRRIAKIPDSIDKFIILKDYYKIEKTVNDNRLEFNMLKFLYSYVRTIPRGK